VKHQQCDLVILSAWSAKVAKVAVISSKKNDKTNAITPPHHLMRLSMT
jgi:hypothetical protein